jgi:hypothetical protein
MHEKSIINLIKRIWPGGLDREMVSADNPTRPPTPLFLPQEGLTRSALAPSIFLVHTALFYAVEPV